MRLSGTQRWLPVGYFLAALSLTAMLLPSALRPPPQAPPSSAQLSPDAPPDDSEILLSELGSGRSATAGTGLGVNEPVDEPEAATLPKQVLPRRGRCWGDPPRQTESLYSAPCAPAFVGDNGGATSKGVTGNEINIGVHWGGTYDGPVREPGARQSDDERTYRAWQAYFNDRYEFYGREMRLIMINTTGAGDPAVNKAAIANAEAQWPLFGFTGASLYYPAYEEAIRRKAVVYEIDADLNHGWLEANFPYAYAWRPHMQRAIGFAGEIVCKQLAGKPPEYNERMDPTFDYNAPRKFGLIAYEEADGFRLGAPGVTRSALAKCGEEVHEVVQYNLYDEQSTIAGAVTKLRAAGVTTVLLWTENVTPLVLTQEATNSGYFPEWLNMASSWQTNGGAQGYSQEQWRHAMSIFSMELPRPPGHDDCSVAYKSQDPDGNPRQCWMFRALQQYANGIQLAGPDLTPLTFFEGLTKTPCRQPEPPWSIGGCYARDDLTYPDYFALGWWDPEADPPDDSDPGGYRFMYDGGRFKTGEVPPESPWFKEGITTPEDPVQRG